MSTSDSILHQPDTSTRWFWHVFLQTHGSNEWTDTTATRKAGVGNCLPFPLHTWARVSYPEARPLQMKDAYLSVQTQFIFSRAILDQMIWLFKITKWNHHRFRVEWTWSFPYDDWSMPSTHVRWNQIKGAQDVAICNTVLHLQACSLGLLHMLLFAGCHSLGTVDMGYRLLFCSAFFTFAYNA